MLTRIKFVGEHRCFKPGDEIELRPGVNMLVGDQGSGKSTVINGIMSLANLRYTGLSNLADLMIVDTDMETKLFGFDFEKDNIRMVRSFDDAPIKAILAARFSSHGETVNAMFGKMVEESVPHTFLLDEPDMALSIRSILRLANTIKEAAKTHQIICSAHNPYLIEKFEEVLSLEHRKWMSSEEFIQSHKV